MKKLIYNIQLLILSITFGLSATAQSNHFESVEPFLSGNYTFGDDLLWGAGGISFVDFNQDGWDDLTLGTSSGEPLMFFINNNGSLEPVNALVDDTSDVRQILWVDYDNDSDLDLFIGVLVGQNRLFRNDGNLTFTDITASSGLNIVDDLTYGASFGDIDNDGDLDLYISNHTYIALEPYFTTNFLYENVGGTFQDITFLSGTADSLKLSFCTAIADFDQDGLQDIYLANDRTVYKNVLFRNWGDNIFLDIAGNSDADIAISAMNTGVADFDNDNDLDIYITNTPDGNALLVNDGNASFTNMAEEYNLLHNKTSWGGNFMDIDNDLDLDLFVSTGFIQNKITTVDTSFYYIQESGNFTKHIVPFGESPTNLYGNAFGDFNNDGLLDVFVQSSDPFHHRLFENKVANSQNWLKVELKGTQSNSMGIGTWVRVFVGDAVLTRYLLCGEAFLAQNSNQLHFGLRDNNMVDSIQVSWLSGIVDNYYDVGSNQIVRFEEGETVSDPTSTHHLTQQNIMLDILPNPSPSLGFKVTGPMGRSLGFQITNMHGQLVTQGILQHQNTTSHHEIGLSHLPIGIYQISLLDNGTQITTRKWVKSR